MQPLTTNATTSIVSTPTLVPPIVNGQPITTSPPTTAEPQERPPWLLFSIFLFSALLVLALYGWSVKSGTVVFIELLVAAASMGSGALLGFLFGIPRGPALAESSDKTSTATNFRPSNSLEQVTEWLTKILVGAGLVQLAKVSGALSILGDTVKNSLDPPPAGSKVVTQLVVVAFLLYGFLITYLWTRINYNRIQVLSDRDLQDELNQALQEASLQKQSKEKALSIAADLVTGAITTPNTPPPTESATKGLAPPEQSEGWPPDVRNKVEEFKNTASNWNDDTAGRLFRGAPEESNGKVLEADLVAVLRRAAVINLRVRTEKGEPLDDTVMFLLHPSFSKSVLEVPPTKDRAETRITAGEWFTVVAILDNGKTVLSYDLRKLPAPEWFKLGSVTTPVPNASGSS